MTKIVLRSVLLLALALADYTAFADATFLTGDYSGRIKIGSNSEQNGILHIRKIQTGDNKVSLIAVLAVADRDEFGVALPYEFNEFFLNERESVGVFSLHSLPRNALGEQVVNLEVMLDNSGALLHGNLTSNLISPDGALIEASFEFRRAVKKNFIPLG